MAGLDRWGCVTPTDSDCRHRVKPKLVEDGLGGTYFIKGQDGGEPIAVFKPKDEEAMAVNNPKVHSGSGGGAADNMHRRICTRQKTALASLFISSLSTPHLAALTRSLPRPQPGSG